MDFTHYTVDDFLLDESFQAYVADADSVAGHFWQGWLLAHPAQQAAADEAATLVRALRQARPLAVPASLEDAEYARLQQAIRQPPALPRLRTQRRWRVLAGVLTSILVMALGLSWWRWLAPATPAGDTVRYAAGASQRRTVTLPDGSVVVLNANSTLTTAAHWTAASPREVWLTGEGFFRVAHRAPRPVADIAAAAPTVKFVVHAADLNIAVLGTQFDVSTQAGATKVVLASGRVAVERRSWVMRENLLMQPGDLVEASASHPQLTRRRVPSALYSAWTKGFFEFHQTPVRDIMQLLRDTYGLQVSVADPALLSQQVSGAVAVTKAELLLPALAEILDLRVTRTGNIVRFARAR
ncbi:FecR family protein [Hymenobacter ginsengisoli]|uniref:FecR family protein n=1 Tax=Hymenobacter ginsengisoli TaxID=1051626 RepID=A0ABP8Q3V8_9BACT|nr:MULTISPECIES: FecR domain-containing protein [unclassified Hymenobacter]MBO2032511.1 FecR domain-containing protein [Hymenobacter sp. BT559]